MTGSHAAMLLLDLAFVLVLARAVAVTATRLGQPAVMGELCAGILVGPTILGRSLSSALFPADTRPMLGGLAAVGLALFIFLMGLELDTSVMRGYGRVAVAVSAGSMALSFALGAGLAVALAARETSGGRLGFVLFMGAAMSVTAFPVLARILTDTNLHRTPLGGLALAAAAIDDVLAWSMLAAVVAVIGAAGGSSLRIVLVVPYVAVMVLVVRPLLALVLAERPHGTRMSHHPPASNRLVVVLVGLLCSAAATEWLGLHYVFGAFLFGIVMPRVDTVRVTREITSALGRLTSVLLLPLFFLLAGLQVDLSGVGSAALILLGLVLVTATAGKFLGAYAAARWCRVHPRESLALGVLMNSRGVTGVVFVSIGRHLGFLSGELYSIMLVMAVVTTAMCGPLLRLLYHPNRHRERALLVGASDGSGIAGAVPDGGTPVAPTRAPAGRDADRRRA